MGFIWLPGVLNPTDQLSQAAPEPASPTPMETSGCEPADLCEAFSTVILDTAIRDVDAEDFDNPMLCSEYVKEIYTYLRQVEVNLFSFQPANVTRSWFSFLPVTETILLLQTEQNVRPNFLQGQEVTGNMRAILVDWLVQVNLKFRLLQETMYMTVGLIDRFLQVRILSQDFCHGAAFTDSMITALKHVVCPNRKTQCPRSSCSWLASQPCSSLPNTRRCILLRSPTLPTWRTGPTPPLRSGTWRWKSCGCSSFSWVGRCPCSFYAGPQRFLRWASGCHGFSYWTVSTLVRTSDWQYFSKLIWSIVFGVDDATFFFFFPFNDRT